MAFLLPSKMAETNIHCQWHLLYLMLLLFGPFIWFILFGLPRRIFFLVITVIRVGFVSVHFKGDMFTHFHTQSIGQRNGNNPVSSFNVKVDTPICIVISRTFWEIEVLVFCSAAMCRCPWWRTLLGNWRLLYYNIIITTRDNKPLLRYLFIWPSFNNKSRTTNKAARLVILNSWQPGSLI